jgi:hypothetical protein
MKTYQQNTEILVVKLQYIRTDKYTGERHLNENIKIMWWKRHLWYDKNSAYKVGLRIQTEE